MNRSRQRWASGLAGALAGAALALGAGCGDSGQPEAAPAAPPRAQPAAPAPAPAATPAATSSGITEAARGEAQQIFGTRCMTCHGPEGKGDGPGSAALQPPPRNFQDPTWQESVTDQHIETIIQYGGIAVGKSPAMPANPDLMSKPAVVAALREHVRSLKPN
jgi:mono/diheme cytochrome c family protein